jgi:ketosteroid isomerase-like protein
MPDETAEVVREPITLRASSRRRLEERLALRFPRALASFARAVWRLPLRSRLRRAALRRTMVLSWEALNRHDFEVTFALYDPDTETIFPPKLVSVGWEPVYRGRETRIEVQERVMSEWGAIWFESEELISLGDGRLLTLMRVKGSGLKSGAPVENEWATIFTIVDGRVTREQIFTDHGEALEAAGLRE